MSDKPSNVTRVDFTRGARAGDRGLAEARKLTAGVPLAMVIPRKLMASSETVMLTEPRSLPAEMYRRLRALLASRQELTQVIAVTSSGPGEGKSSAATNLALAFSESEQERVLLLDADMRCPRIHQWIDPQPRIGLAEVISGEAGLEDAVHYLKNSPLKILPAGVPPIDPMQRLQSNSFIDLMCRLRERYDRVIIDVPPILGFPDAEVVGDLADGALIVVKAGVTSRRNYLSAVSTLKSTEVLGAVRSSSSLNLADLRPVHEGYSPSYYKMRNGAFRPDRKGKGPRPV